MRITTGVLACMLLFGTVAAFARAANSGADRPTLRVAVVVTPNTLNPLLHTQTTESLLISMIFDGIVRSAPDGTIVPVLAAVVPTSANGGISRDGRTITYKLRRGIKWHDGMPFTSRDVAFTQRAAVNPNNNVTSHDPYRSVTSIDAPNDDTVVVHLAQRYAPFVAEWFAGNGTGILPVHLLAARSQLNDVPFNSAPVGTGAFVFDHWDRGRDIVLRANDAYVLGKPQLARVVVQLMADDNSRGLALRTGATDWAFQTTATVARQFVGSTTVQTVLLDVNGFTGLRLQTRRPPLDDVRVRRAVALALDRPAMVAKISGGFAVPAASDIGPAVWAYDRNVKPLPYDPAHSRTLLDAAGWKVGVNGIRERDGRRLSLQLVYPAGNPVNEAYGVQVQSLLHTVGIDVSIKSQQANMLFAPAAQHGVLPGGNFDKAYVSFFNGADPNDRRSFGCASIPPNGFNISRWCNAEYDRVTNDALLHTDRATRTRDYSRASRILVDDAPEVFVTWPKDIELVRPGVHIDDGARNPALSYRIHIDK